MDISAVVFEIKVYHIATVLIFALASGFAIKKAYKSFKVKKMIQDQESEIKKTEAIEKNINDIKEIKIKELDNLDHSLYLMSKENLEFADRKGRSIRFYNSVITEKNGQIYSSSSDFNDFLAGMILSKHTIKNFNRDKARNSVDSFSKYALISALYFFRDLGYLDSENYRQNKISEAKQFMADEFGIDFTKISSSDDFFMLVRLIAKTSPGSSDTSNEIIDNAYENNDEPVDSDDDEKVAEVEEGDETDFPGQDENEDEDVQDAIRDLETENSLNEKSFEEDYGDHYEEDDSDLSDDDLDESTATQLINQ